MLKVLKYKAFSFLLSLCRPVILVSYLPCDAVLPRGGYLTSKHRPCQAQQLATQWLRTHAQAARFPSSQSLGRCHGETEPGVSPFQVPPAPAHGRPAALKGVATTVQGLARYMHGGRARGSPPPCSSPDAPRTCQLKEELATAVGCLETLLGMCTWSWSDLPTPLPTVPWQGRRVAVIIGQGWVVGGWMGSGPQGGLRGGCKEQETENLSGEAGSCLRWGSKRAVRAPFPHGTSLTKHKLSDKMITNIKRMTTEHWTLNTGPFWWGTHRVSVLVTGTGSQPCQGPGFPAPLDQATYRHYLKEN